MIMHSDLLHSEKESDSFPYTYLLEWDWPEHIELMLRRLIWARLVELTEESNDMSTPVESDYLAAKVCWMMVSHPGTHPAVLDVMASVDSSAFAERIAEHPRAVPSTLARLAGHASPEVRAAVAENHNTPAEILAILVHDDHADVRYAMAENHQLSEEALQTLSEDENCYVASRARRTLNRICPPSVMTMPLQRTQRAKDTMRKFAVG
jgi:Leucine rich repeat variant